MAARGVGRLAALCLVAVVAGACSDGDAEGPGFDASGPFALVDAEGRTVHLTRTPERIVSLVPSVSRILLELGAGPTLVGRTDFDRDSALLNLPSVGGGLHPSLEALVALRPDLVVRFGGETDRTTPARLDELGIPHFAVRPDGIADVRATVAWMGTLTDRVDPATRLLASIDARLAAVRAAGASEPPVTAAFVMDGRPPWVAGDGTYIDELIELAGGRNAFDDLGRLYGPVSPEELRARPLDVVLLAPSVELDPGLVGQARVERLPPSVLLPGPDLPAAAEAVLRALRPAGDA